MLTHLHYILTFQDNFAVRILDRVKRVSNNDDRFFPGEHGDGIQDRLLVLRVEGCRGLIEKNNRGVF